MDMHRWKRIPALAGILLIASPVFTNARPYETVTVSGNEFLASDDILATCQISADEDFSAPTRAAIRDCLMSTGQFARVGFAPEGNKMVIEVEELNTRPGRVEFGIAYDSQQGPLAQFYLERYNLFPGIFGAVSLSFSDQYAGLRTNFYRPDTFAGGWDLGLDMEAFESDFDDQSYTHRRVSIEPYIAHELGADGRVEIGLGYRQDSLNHVAPTGSALIAREAGQQEAPYLRLGYDYAPDNWAFEIDQYIFGLGESDVVSKTALSARTSLPLNDNGLDLLLSFGAGHVTDLKGRAPRITDRFFLGGDALRGFAPRGVGPKDGVDFLGGQNFATASIELQKDIGQILGTSTRLGGFVDVGSVWDLDDTLGGTVEDDLEWRASAGLSLTMDIGNVPVSAYLATPIRDEPGDDSQVFGLSISARF